MRRAGPRWGFITTLLLSCSVATSRSVKRFATSRRLVTFIGQAPLAARRPLVGASPSAPASPTAPVRTFASRSLLLAMATAATSTGSVAGSSGSGTSGEGSKRLRTLETLNFDNAALRSLPVDPEERNFVRAVSNACYSHVTPEPLRNPMLVAASLPAMSELLDLSPSEVSRPEFAAAFGGNVVLPGSTPYSHCYCGHQFGFFSGQLGDGAAIALGEVVNSNGQRWELQLKGAGPTPYSRRADGRKVLRSSVREFLCSEAMHHLHVPTTRAGALVTSDTLTPRDIFYNGNVINERCTVVLRLSPTFFRFGSFEIVRGRDAQTGRQGPSAGNHHLLRQMLHYVIDGFFPSLASSFPSTDALSPAQEEMKFQAFYDEVAVSTARMVAKWQAVGFTHGVLNTDNMSVLGLTIDYGPFGFMEWFDRDYIPNGSDNSGRYTYDKQPEICRWNVGKLGETLSPVMPLDPGEKERVLERYDEAYEAAYLSEMRAKLGLESQDANDKELIESLFSAMQATQADFTRTFVTLSSLTGHDDKDKDDLAKALAAVCGSPENVMGAMKRKRKIIAPKMPIPQITALWDLVERAPEQLSQIFAGPTDMIIEELRQEMDKVRKTQAVDDIANRMRGLKPEEKRAADTDVWRGWVDKYVLRLSNEDRGAEARAKAMAEVNPSFVLRAWIAQDAIEAAEKKDFSRVQAVLALLQHPFQADPVPGVPEELASRYCAASPDWAASLLCT